MFTLKTGSQDEAKTIQTDLIEAQRWCNFTLMQPSWLPDDVQIIERSLRPEQADGLSSSYRMLAQGDERTLTIKQFLFDFAPPAYDHPALWRNPKKTAEDEFPDPKLYLIDEQVLWIGRDHRRYPAATIGFSRVRVEMTVKGGSFSDQELAKICEGLRPVDQAYAELLDQTPFAELAYQRRHARRAISVPLSYWTHQRQSAHRYLAKSIDEITLPFSLPDFAQLGYQTDSFFVIETEDNQPVEIDAIYEAKKRNGAYLRLLVTPSDSVHPILFPPEKYTQACQTESAMLGDQPVYIAWLDATVGPYEIVFKRQDWICLLLVQPAKWTDRLFLDQLLSMIPDSL